MSPFDRLGMVSYYRSIVTLSLRYWDIRLLTIVTLKPGLGVTQGHRNRYIFIFILMGLNLSWYVSIGQLWFPINVPGSKKKLELRGYPRKKFDDIFSHLATVHQRGRRTDRRTDRQRATAKTALMHITSRSNHSEVHYAYNLTCLAVSFLWQFKGSLRLEAISVGNLE